MLLSIQKLEIKKIPFDTTYEPGKLDFAESGLTQLTPLHATGEAELLENTGGEVRVQGHISVTMGADCDRCLAKAQFAIDAPFDLFYEPSSAVENEAEIAISEGAAEIGFYNGSGIELEEILQEQVLLMTPMHRLCSEDCQGICPICGKNRNEVSCHCSVVPADDRWSELKQLKLG